MKILQNLQVPTGNIVVVEGYKGKLELLSLGDYGKDVNLKCDAMGLTREPDQVRHTQLLPLTEKWVITISTQYGCSMGCNFCDVPSVGPGKNASFEDLIGQVKAGLNLHPELKSTDRLNVHFARMGEPTFNRDVLDAAVWLSKTLPEFNVHPVVSTMMPARHKGLHDFIDAWMDIKNGVYVGNTGLQLSINSTDELERGLMFGGSALPLHEIANVMQGLVPLGRKITLNFAVADYTIDPDVLLKYFNPDHYIIKLTPMHKTVSALDNGVKTAGDYTEYVPYQEIEKKLVQAGYDVLVFIASEEEDLGRITCGNAILSGTMPEVEYQDVA